MVRTERGERTFAPGDRVMFLRNKRSMGVKNGTLGTLERIDGAALTVRLDGSDRREVRFDVKDYAKIDHGYASTIHKSQGVTVDHGHLLASDGSERAKDTILDYGEAFADGGAWFGRRSSPLAAPPPR